MSADGLSLSELTAAVEQRTGGRLKATLIGAETRVGALAPLASAGPGDLAFLANARYRADALATRAGAVVVAPADVDALQSRIAGVALIVVDQPYAWFAHAAQLLHPAAAVEPGVAPGAVIGAGVRIDPSACVEAGACIGDGAEVGARARIGAGAVLGANAVIGADTRLHPRAVVLDRCRVGARCIVASGAVIGADGFGFGRSTAAGSRFRRSVRSSSATMSKSARIRRSIAARWAIRSSRTASSSTTRSRWDTTA
jgi:UDP-3-O-[3-hydroxymyristoyl] glucosamine N-acyltransferase